MSNPKEMEELMRFAFRGRFNREPTKKELQLNMDILDEEMDRLDWEDAMEQRGLQPYKDVFYPGMGNWKDLL